MVSFRKLLEYIVLLSLLEPTVKAAVSCPTGDTAGVIKDGLTCSALITSDNSECYTTSTETACCASCNTVSASNPASCPYGDNATCHSILCSSYTGSALQGCCDTCAVATTTTTDAPTTTAAPTTAAPTTAAPTTAAPTTAAPTTAAPTTAAPTTAGSGASPDSSSNGNNAGVIAGAVVGSITSSCLLIGGAFVLVRWFNKKNKVDSESTENLPEKVDSNHKPADIESDIPVKPYNTPVLIAPTLPPKNTPFTNNQNINNNTNKDEASVKSEQTNNNTNKDEATEKSQQSNNNTNEENNDLNKAEDNNKTVSNDFSTETHVDTEMRRQSLPPLQGAKSSIATNNEPLPPIAYKK